MLKAALITNKGPIALIGLNDENILRMRAGMPLDIDIKELTPPGTRVNRVIIHLAHTYTEVVEDMIKEGIPMKDEFRQRAQEMDERIRRERRARKQ